MWKLFICYLCDYLTIYGYIVFNILSLFILTSMISMLICQNNHHIKTRQLTRPKAAFLLKKCFLSILNDSQYLHMLFMTFIDATLRYHIFIIWYVVEGEAQLKPSRNARPPETGVRGDRWAFGRSEGSVFVRISWRGPINGISRKICYNIFLNGFTSHCYSEASIIGEEIKCEDF